MEPGQALSQFDAYQGALAATMNPDFIRQNTKQVIGNLLMMAGLPFFLQRLEKHLGAETAEKVRQLVSDPKNIISNTKKFATQLFEDKVLTPVREQVLNEAAKYVPELKNIDLTKASLDDVINAFQKSAINKLKSNLPQEIADRLPENFTRDDIFNAFKNISSDQALAYARKTLPPEIYNELAARQDLINDPSKIGDFMRGKFNEIQSGFGQKVNQLKSSVKTQLSEISDQMGSEFDKTLKPFRDTIDNLKQQKSKLADNWQSAQNELNDRFTNAKQALEDYKSQNPGFSEDDIAPFKSAVKSIQQEARDQRTAFQSGDSDLTDQINNAQSVLESKSQELLNTFNTLKERGTNTVSNLVNTANEQFNNTIKSGKQALKPIEDTLQGAEDTIKEAPGLLERLNSRVASIRQRATNFFNTTRSDSIQPAEGGMGYSIQDPGELESGFSTTALERTGINKNPVLNSYYGSENDTPASLIKTDRDLVIRQPIEKQTLQAKPSQGRVKRYNNTQPEFTDQEEAQRVLSQQLGRPVEVLPRINGQSPLVRQQQESEIEPATAPEPAPAQQAQELSPEIQAQLPDITPLSETPKAPLISSDIPVQPEATEQIVEKATSTGSKVLGGLEDTGEALAAASESVPILDAIVDIGGLFGSVFGANALMKQHALGQPIITGSVFEPDL